MMYLPKKDIETIIQETAKGREGFIKIEVINEAIDERFEKIISLENEIKTLIEEIELLTAEGNQLYTSWFS